MRDKIFGEILRIYPSCRDLSKRRRLTDKILALIKEHYIPIEYYRQQLDKFSISNGDSCEMCQIAYNDMGKALPVPCENILRKKGWKPPEEILNLPIDGVQVTFTCPECDGKKEYIHNGFTGDFDSNGQPIIDEELKGKLVPCDCVDGKMVRHLTIGELLEILPDIMEELYIAAIDKIYGNTEQYDEFKAWLEKNKPSAVQYLYPRDIYHTSESRPISNFPEEIDKWLLKNCNIEWVIKRIKEQYDIK